MPARTVYLETFGCQMNELDSELVIGQLRALGYGLTANARAADVVLYNTCSVREHAEQKVRSRLGELAIRKREQPELVGGVLGCLAERDGVALIKRMPVVDVLCGPGELDKLPALLDNAFRTRAALLADDPAPRVGSDGEVSHWAAERSASQVALQGSASRRSAVLAAAEDSLEMLDLSRAVSPIDADTDPHTGRPRSSAYVRITRGCNKFCTYCVVPFTRGAEIHRPPDHILDECKRLADAGVIEITLLGQTVNHYRFEHGAAVSVNGVTQPQKGRSYSGGHRRDPFASEQTTTFADLLARIHEEVPAIQRLRFVTSYPRDFGDDVLEVMRQSPRICRYLHVPAQSGSDRLLKMMNRGYSVSEYLEFLDRARGHLDQPEINRPLMVSGDFIVGFPTETDEDFEATVSLLNSFISKYPPRPGTTAIERFPDDVPEAVKRARNNRLLALQAEVSDEISREQIGREFSVLVEGLSRKQAKRQARARENVGAESGLVALTVSGRSPAAEPETQPEPAEDQAVQFSGRTDGDQIVFLDVPAGSFRNGAGESLIGRIVRVRVTGARVLGLTASLLKD
ncbi:MAG: tRNA-2-methylthio-N(6)-dimethylallyladenosine synthase [Phycisphaerales bacterium]|nr:tRNA-2-methylthio-N(6)-dimethylallyladenosine synthase [Phycisphaerales bacterium]